jgi:PPOX class probable F420-dependent enzyme
MMAIKIPDSHRDLFNRPVYAVLSTLMPDGQPQSSIVWADYDGEHILINTTLERQKCKNLQHNACLAVLVIDPSDTSRWIEVRGKAVAFLQAGAEAHADGLTQRYTGKLHFYGDIYPVERRQQETRVIVKIEPVRVALDAIFR